MCLGCCSIPTKQKQMLYCFASSAPTRPPRLRMGAQRYLSAPTDAPPHLLPPAHVTLPSYLATPKYINENPCDTKRSTPAAVQTAAHYVAAEIEAQAYQLDKSPRHHSRLVNWRHPLQDLRPTSHLLTAKRIRRPRAPTSGHRRWLVLLNLVQTLMKMWPWYNMHRHRTMDPSAAWYASWNLLRNRYRFRRARHRHRMRRADH